MEHMATQMDQQIDGATSENERLANEVARLRDALDHIARVAIGSRKATKRTLWIFERAKSALNGDDLWKQAGTPKGYHNALVMRYPPELSGGEAVRLDDLLDRSLRRA